MVLFVGSTELPTLLVTPQDVPHVRGFVSTDNSYFASVIKV